MGGGSVKQFGGKIRKSDKEKRKYCFRIMKKMKENLSQKRNTFKRLYAKKVNEEKILTYGERGDMVNEL